MTAMTPVETERRLRRLCGMMGSDHDGERANAAALADRLIRDSGLTWDAVIHLTPPRPQPARNWRAVVSGCRGQATELTTWEKMFLADISWRPRDPSPKQLAVLASIARRLRVPT